MHSYRNDIDGLRALAVLGVIGAHLGVSQLEGGFAGVDVFFVISGYLITALLAREYSNSGRISFTAFFGRRVRRLAPALLATVTLSLLAGYLLFSDERFSLLTQSSIASIFSVSNIYFWSQVGYFDAEASSKPLLHTWSLGVEEQFYIFWPLIIAIALKLRSRAHILAAILLLSVASFVLNLLFIEFEVGASLSKNDGFWAKLHDGAASAFYLFPFRVFEFGIGALIAFLPNIFTKERSCYADFSVLLGSAIVVGYILLLDESSIFPYYNALGVSVGTALIIYAGASSRISRVIFANFPARLIGKISYSLYLVHWPLIVFFAALYGEEFTLPIQLSLLGCMFLLGYILHVTVEKPLRNASFLKGKPAGVYGWLQRAALPVALVAVVSSAYYSSGMGGRVPEHRKTFTNKEWRYLQRSKYCGGKIPGYPKEIFTCQNFRNSDNTIVVWGDSHASHLVAGISEVFSNANVAIAYTSGCPPHSGYSGVTHKLPTSEATRNCIQRNYDFVEWTRKSKNPQTILITSAKRQSPKQVSEAYRYLTLRLVEYGHFPLFIGDFIRPGRQIAQCRAVPDFVLSDSFLLDMCKPNRRTVTRELEYNEMLEHLVANFIQVNDVQCPNGQCNFVDEFGVPLHRDSHHLSTYGSTVMIQKLYPELIRRAPGLLAFSGYSAASTVSAGEE